MNTINTRTPQVIAISTSDSPDMTVFGLSEGHLREAVADLAMYLLASGSNLAYGGDLRADGLHRIAVRVGYALSAAGRRHHSGD